MVKIGKFFAYLLFFIIALMYFMPKKSIYYFAEKELQKQGVVIAHEAVKDTGFSLELRHLDIYVRSIESASVKELDISLFGIYNGVSMQDIELSSTLSSMLPTEIKKVTLLYTLLHPLTVELSAVGAFGTLHADVNLKERKMSAVLQPSDIMKRKYRQALRNFKKQANGEYEYVQSF